MTNLEIGQLRNTAIAGAKAKALIQSEHWPFITDVVLGTLADESMVVLMKANTHDQRMKAQQMALAAKKFQDILSKLQSDGAEAERLLKEESEPDPEGGLDHG